MIHTIHRLLRSATLASQRASAPHSSPPTRTGGTGTKLMLTLAAGLLLSAASAQASHFRGASLTWKKLATPANTIELTVTESWRTGSVDSLSYTWGDNIFFDLYSGANVVATNSDFTIIRKVLTHTYATAGPFTISGSSCCRISNLVNAADGSESVQSVVDLRGGNAGPPVITSPIILQMIRGGVNNIQIAASDVDGDTVTFRMATSAESQIPSVASAGGKTLSISSSGLLTWDTSSTSVGQLYAVQVIAKDNHLISSGVFGTSSVPFDFIIQIVDGTVNHPPVASIFSSSVSPEPNGSYVAAIGQPISIVVRGTDPDGGNLTVTHQGLPTGATLTPASGTQGAQPLNATFSWTPTISDAGSSVGVTIVFADPTQLQASKSFAISIPANQPPVANAGPDQTIYDIDGNDVPISVALDGTASFDPEHVQVDYTWTAPNGITLSDIHSGTPSFTAPSLHIHPNGQPAPLQLLFRLDVSDKKTTRSDDVLIIVKHNNLAPTAAATAPASAPEGTPVTLDGSASTDPDQDPLSYLWTQWSGTPVGLPTNATNNSTLNFGAAVLGPHSIPGEWLEFKLTVSDGIESRVSAPVPVFIRNVNQRPLVDAGHADPAFDNGVEVALDGMAFDPDGDAVSLLWEQIAGPEVTLSDPTSDEPTFLTPVVTAEQGSVTLTFRLTVSDAIDGKDPAALTAQSTVDVLVTHGNRAPIADAGKSGNAPELSTVTLNGSGSYDPDQDAIASYTWTQVGEQTVVLDTTDPIHPTFTAPDVTPAGEKLTFQLVVTDTPKAGSGESLSSAPSTVVINVQYVNRAPIANAGATPAADEGSIVTLNGSGSDPDGNAITFQWTKVSGPDGFTLSDATAASPTFTAPAVDRNGATLIFALQTKDEFGLVSKVSTTSVNIRNVNHTPVADAGETLSVPEDTTVSLAGLAADQDTEEEPLLTYAWQQTGGPSVMLTGGDTLSPSFHAPIVTGGGNPLAKVTLKFKLTVTDPNTAFATDEVEVIVANVDHSPIANAGGVTIVNEAVPIALNGSLSSDPDGDALTYSWVQIGGAPVPLANANTASPSFTAPLVTATGTTLKFKLTVTDGFGGSSSDCATLSVVNINDPPTVTNPQASLGTLWPPDHRMVLISIAGVVDPNNNATITITGVTQDEPTNGQGDGDTAIDAIINADGTVLVRSERTGKGNGRVYHIHFTASDFEGSVSGVVKVSVPHDKKGEVAIDGGELFDSTH